MSSFWFDPMVNTVGMPNNPGPGGNNLAATQAMQSQLAQQQAYAAAQNQAALRAAAPMPPGYGQVHLPYLSGSFGPAAAAGTYSPGSGRSSFSGVSLGGGGGGGSVFDTGTTPFQDYGLPGGGGAGSFSPSPNYQGGQGFGLSPLSSYQGGGYNAFDPSIYSAAAQKNVGSGYGGGASAPAPDFDFRWGDTPHVSGRPFQDEYEDWFSGITGNQGARGKIGGWEGSYLNDNPDVLAAAKASGRGLNAFAQEHANIYGGPEGRQLFDSVKYLQNNKDVAAAGMDAYDHYNQFGRKEGRAATYGNIFDPKTYLMNNKDVLEAGVDPRTHWLQFGIPEGRKGGGVVADTRDNIAKAMMQGTPTGPNAQGMQGPGGRDYQAWNPMTGGNASVQQLVNQGAGLNMPSGFGGSTYADNRMYGAPASGYLGAQGTNVQDAFSAYVNPRSLDAGGSFPPDYRPGYYASPFAGNAPGS